MQLQTLEKNKWHLPYESWLGRSSPLDGKQFAKHLPGAPAIAQETNEYTANEL